MSVAPSSRAAQGVGYSLAVPSLVPQEMTWAQASFDIDWASRSPSCAAAGLADIAMLLSARAIKVITMHTFIFTLSKKALWVDVDVELNRAMLFWRGGEPFAQVSRKIEVTGRPDQQTQAMAAAH